MTTLLCVLGIDEACCFCVPYIMAKQKRRGHGEGTVYQRKDGRWVAEITLEDGKRKVLYGKTQKEVIEKLQQVRYEQKQGRLATGPRQKLRDYLEQWLEEVHKPTIRLTTYARYRSALNRHIIPALGHIQIQKLTPQQVQAFYTRKLQEGLSAKTIVSTIHVVLHKALDNAVRWNLVARNICDVVSLPRRSRNEIQPLTRDQAQRLLEVARGHRFEALLTVALITGMRRGELLALRWQDIDIDTGSLQVRRTVSRIRGHGYVETDPKTEKSRRKITLPLPVVEVLKQHRTVQLEARLKAGKAWQDNDLVFCNIYGRYLHPDRMVEQFQKLLRDAGLPHLRFHDLRHSAATILLSMGVHAKVVQELLGHSTISVTMDVYSHVLPSMQKDAMDKWDDLF